MEGREEVVPSSRRQKKMKETQESLRPEVANKRLIMMTMPRSFNIVTIAERRLQWFEHVERRHQASIMQKVLLLGEGERGKTISYNMQKDHRQRFIICEFRFRPKPEQRRLKEV